MRLVLRPLLVLALALGAAGCASRSSSGLPPLPSDSRVTRPGPDVPRDRAAYSGQWTGKWDGQQDTVLVVEEIRGGEAQVLVGWAAAPALGLESPGYARYRGEFAGDALVVRTFRLVPPATLTYRMRPDGNLDARFERGSATSQATLTRVRS